MASYVRDVAGFRIEVEDSTDNIRKAIENAINRGLKAIGETAVGYAQQKCPKETGRLAGSITYIVSGDELYIGTNVEYAAYVEFGTGKHSTLGGRMTPWVYVDEKGKWHRTEGQRPQPYLLPAARDHTSEYRSILKDSLINA